MSNEAGSWVEDVNSAAREIIRITARQEERDLVVKFLKEFDPILALAITKEEHLK